MSVPIAPLTVIVPLPEVKVTSSLLPPATPVREAIVIAPAPVSAVSKLKVCASTKVTAPKASASSLVAIVPDAVTAPAVAVTPPLKVFVSPVASPIWVVPVFEKVTALVIVDPPNMETL